MKLPDLCAILLIVTRGALVRASGNALKQRSEKEVLLQCYTCKRMAHVPGGGDVALKCPECWTDMKPAGHQVLAD